MVMIERGGHTLSVTRGAFQNLYKRLGYVVVGAGEAHEAPSASSNVTITPEDSYPDVDASEAPEEDYEATEDDEVDYEEKPLNEMSLRELQDYAAKLGLNANGYNTKRELRQAIRKATK
jgi:hypothetical protein